MIVTTTPSVEGHRIVAYNGIVTGEAIMGANIFRDIMASVRDPGHQVIVGGMLTASASGTAVLIEQVR